MGKSISAKQKKRGRGRPPTGITPMVGLRMPAEMRKQAEALAEEEGITLSKKLLNIIADGLAKKKGKPDVGK
jgi:hypothetical protein